MGRNSKKRRDDKQRARERDWRERAAAGPAPAPVERPPAERPPTGDRGDRADSGAARAGGPRGSDEGLGTLGRELEAAVSSAWRRGWQPTDLARIVRQELGVKSGRLAVDLIAAERARTVQTPADPRWEAQLEAIECRVWWPQDDVAFLVHWVRRHGLDAVEAVEAAVPILLLLGRLPLLPILIPPPGSPVRHRSTSADRRGIDPKLLSRVQALLAKAESTEFPEEAESFTAKAQELMARHAIDEAMLDGIAGGRSADEPEGRRFGVEDPYAMPKGRLLSEISGANRCRAVLSLELGFGTVFGYPVDLDHVEMLYASLLVQSSAALAAAGSGERSGARARSRAFRQSFLLGFAFRIGERLQAAVEHATEEANVAHGAGMLPVLAGRRVAVDELRIKTFPSTRQLGSVNVNDGAGWHAGRAAADQASLGAARQRLPTPG